MIAALHLDPFPLYLAQRQDPALERAPLVYVEDQRVLHATPAARRHGITPGMRLSGARMRVEGLRVVELEEPALQQGWSELLREIHGITPWIEEGPRGRLLARLDRGEAEMLAGLYQARVGAARTREIADLAAAASRPGACRVVPVDGEDAFLERLPLRFLKSVGVTEKNLMRLHWLGLETVGQLARWNESQLRSYLGEEGAVLLPYLHGPRHADLRPYRLPPSVRRSIAFDEPAREPRELLPALERLAGELERALEGRAARRLTLTATLGGTQRRATRLSKRPLTRARQIRQQALFALSDSGGAGLGVERLTVELASPHRLAMQGALWRGRERRDEAQAATLERFPGALLRFAWRDPYAQAADLAWGWERVNPDEAERGEAVRLPLGRGLPSDPPGSVVEAGAVPLFGDEALPLPDATAVGDDTVRPHDRRDGDAPERTPVRGDTIGGGNGAPLAPPPPTSSPPPEALPDLMLFPFFSVSEDSRAHAHDPSPGHVDERPARRRELVGSRS